MRTARCSFLRMADGPLSGSVYGGVSRLLNEELSDEEEGLVPKARK